MSGFADRRVVVCQSPDDLAGRAAGLIEDAAASAVKARGRFTIALAGGSTPELAYTILARRARSTAGMDWSRAYLFFGDERFVPANDPRSNRAMVERTLLAGLPRSGDRVFPIATEGTTPAGSAAAYAAKLAEVFASPGEGPPPHFDLILLGLGDDGHTASLFPGAAALAERKTWVTWSPPGTLPPPVDRVTLTYPTLNAGRHVFFLVAGAKKAEPLRDVLERNPPASARPAAGVQPAEGIVTWLVDEAAASLLTR